MPRHRNCDLLIAGRGAAGYAAALYAARYRLDTVLAGAVFGGETATSGRIENYPGVPDVDGFDLMLRFAEQVAPLDVELIEADVAGISREQGCFRSVLGDGSTLCSPSVILAIGRERRTLGLANEDEWLGRGISYCSTCDAPLSAGRWLRWWVVATLLRRGPCSTRGTPNTYC